MCTGVTNSRTQKKTVINRQIKLKLTTQSEEVLARYCKYNKLVIEHFWPKNFSTWTLAFCTSSLNKL